MIQTQDGTEMTGSTAAQVVEMPPLLRLELENAHLRTMLLELQLQEAQRTRQKKAQEIAAELNPDFSPDFAARAPKCPWILGARTGDERRRAFSPLSTAEGARPEDTRSLAVVAEGW